MLRLILSEIVIASQANLSSLQVHPQRRPPPLGRDTAGHQLRARLSSAVPAESQQQDGVSEENDQGNTVTPVLSDNSKCHRLIYFE